MTGVLLVTANLGGIDPVFPLPPHPSELRAAVYYTERPGLVPAEVAATWTRIVPTLRTGEPRSAAKFYKCQLHRLPGAAAADFLLWADACLRFNSLEVVAEMVRLSGGTRAVFVPHPNRATVADEYAYVQRQIRNGFDYLVRRYDPAVLERERAHFAQRHNLARLPLWCGGFWMLPRTAAAGAFLDSWWRCVNAYSIFDQCQISPLLADAGLEVAPLDVNIFRNRYFTRVPHA